MNMNTELYCSICDYFVVNCTPCSVALCDCRECLYFKTAEALKIGTVPKSLAIPKLPYKYKEEEALAAIKAHVDGTYDEHYQIEELQLLDVWIDHGTASTTTKNLAEKYLWRYGKKDGKNKKDILKAIHYLMMLLYVDHLKVD